MTEGSGDGGVGYPFSQEPHFENVNRAIFDRLIRAIDSAAESTHGMDQTDSVEVSVNKRGQLMSIEILDGWQRRLSPSHLGEAVTQAAQVALETYSMALQVAQTGVSPDDESSVAGAGANEDGAHGAEPVVVDPEFPPRTGSDFAEAALALSQEVTDLIASSGLLDRKTTLLGDPERIQVEIEEGVLRSCRANVLWSTNRTGAEITVELATLLASASARRIAGISEADLKSISDRSSAMMAEAMSALNNLGRGMAGNGRL